MGHHRLGTAAILPRALFRPADDYQEPTIGAAFLTQTVQLPDATVRYELWDTAGQERYRTLAPMYYRGAAAAVVVYDVTNYSSFEGAKSWVKELQKKGEPGVVIALAGNKSDSKERKVEPEEAAEYAREAGCHHFSTSAKTGANVKEMFTHIARLLPKSGRGGERERDVQQWRAPLGSGSRGDHEHQHGTRSATRSGGAHRVIER